MSKTKFFNDAIAETKAIRETAFSNTKLAIAGIFSHHNLNQCYLIN
jgi:hypothetical protein